MHKHISTDDRAVIAAMLRRGYTKADIARTVGVHRSSIGREVVRNRKPNGTYGAWYARHCATKRRGSAKVRCRKIENDPALTEHIAHLLNPLVSPEVVAHMVGVVHETIYAWIERSRPDLRAQLPYQGRKRRRYGTKRAKKQGWTAYVRPINDRKEGRDPSWEGDTVRGKGLVRVLTHVERASLYTDARLIPNGTADVVHATLKHNPLSGRITYDRGSEFSLWRMIERDTNTTVYFAHAHHPWERGKNENTNGRLRRIFPKKFDFSTLTQRELDRVVHLMNHTPRKSLNWRTPAEVFKELCCNSE